MARPSILLVSKTSYYRYLLPWPPLLAMTSTYPSFEWPSHPRFMATFAYAEPTSNHTPHPTASWCVIFLIRLAFPWILNRNNQKSIHLFLLSTTPPTSKVKTFTGWTLGIIGKIILQYMDFLYSLRTAVDFWAKLDWNLILAYLALLLLLSICPLKYCFQHMSFEIQVGPIIFNSRLGN